jgi:hypothetical protein
MWDSQYLHRNQNRQRSILRALLLAQVPSPMVVLLRVFLPLLPASRLLLSRYSDHVADKFHRRVFVFAETALQFAFCTTEIMFKAVYALGNTDNAVFFPDVVI